MNDHHVSITISSIISTYLNRLMLHVFQNLASIVRNHSLPIEEYLNQFYQSMIDEYRTYFTDRISDYWVANFSSYFEVFQHNESFWTVVQLFPITSKKVHLQIDTLCDVPRNVERVVTLWNVKQSIIPRNQDRWIFSQHRKFRKMCDRADDTVYFHVL